MSGGTEFQTEGAATEDAPPAMSTRVWDDKERKSIYIAPFICYVYLKALRHGSNHIVLPANTPCLS